MKKEYNNKKLISYTAVILWMILIFYLSNQPASDSNELSTGITDVILIAVEKVAPSSDIMLGNVNHLVRKNAHFFIYLVLGLLVLNSLSLSEINRCKEMGIALLICVLYAISDEAHQLFIPGRGAQIKDVFIDSLGAVLGVILYSSVRSLRKVRNKPN